jgi:hypothetical protein
VPGRYRGPGPEGGPGRGRPRYGGAVAQVHCQVLGNPEQIARVKHSRPLPQEASGAGAPGGGVRALASRGGKGQSSAGSGLSRRR